MFGVFCWAHLLPYFGTRTTSRCLLAAELHVLTPICTHCTTNNITDASLTVFYVFGIVLALMGGLVGGVFAVLLPKIANGSALGVFVALFITLVTHECCLFNFDCGREMAMVISMRWGFCSHY